MRFLAWLAVVVPALVVGITVLHVAGSIDLAQPWPLAAGEAAAIGAYIGLNHLVGGLLAARAQRT